MQCQDLMFALQEFSLVFIQSFLSLPHFSPLKWECLPCAIVYWRCLICSFDFLPGFSAEFALSVRGDFELGLLINAGTINSLGALGN
jgi:hypothetical protein